MTTVYFAGGEDSSFNGASSLNIQYDTSSSNGGFRTAYARVAVFTGGAGVTANPSTQRIRAANAAWTNQASLWIHAQYIPAPSNGTLPSATANSYLLAAMSSDGVYRIVVRAASGAGQLKISTCNAAGTFTDLVTSALNVVTANTLQAVDLHIVYGTSGSVTLFLAGTQVATYSGNVVTDSATGIAMVDFVGPYNSDRWSEFIIQDTDTRGCAVYTMPPIANGNTNTWTGTVGAINAIATNYTTPNSVTSANQLAEYTCSTTLPSGTWSVETLWQETSVMAGQGGPQNFEFVTRFSGTDYVAGTTAPVNYLQPYTHSWLLNPGTGVAWTPSDFATGFNYGIESLT